MVVRRGRDNVEAGADHGKSGLHSISTGLSNTELCMYAAEAAAAAVPLKDPRAEQDAAHAAILAGGLKELLFVARECERRRRHGSASTTSDDLNNVEVFCRIGG
jgi:hypothetical protein